MIELRDTDKIYMALSSIKKKYKEGAKLQKQINASKFENDFKKIIPQYKNWLGETSNMLDALYKDNSVSEKFKRDLPEISVPTTPEQYKSEKIKDIENKLDQLNILKHDIINQKSEIPPYERIKMWAHSNSVTAIIMIIVAILAAIFGLMEGINKFFPNPK